MPKFYGQNKKRKDPRYFLHETTNIDDGDTPDLGSLPPDNSGTQSEEVTSLENLWKQLVQTKKYLPDEQDAHNDIISKVVEKLRSLGWEHPYDRQPGDIDSFGNPLDQGSTDSQKQASLDRRQRIKARRSAQSDDEFARDRDWPPGYEEYS